MYGIHSSLKKSLPWYNRWHQHPRHQYAHWLIFISAAILLTSFVSVQIFIFDLEGSGQANAQTGNLPAPNHPIFFTYYKVDANYGDFKSEVNSFVNMFMAETDDRLPVNQYKQ